MAKTGQMFLTVTISLLIAQAALATSYAPVKKEQVYSNDRKHFVVIDPKTERHQVFSSDKPKKVRWDFSWGAGHDTWALSNSGRLVVWVSWRHVKEEDSKRPCIVVFDWHGVKRFYSFDDVSKLRKRGPREVGPIGEFWRVWYESIEVTDDAVTITVAGGGAVEVSLTDGSLVKVKAVKKAAKDK